MAVIKKGDTSNLSNIIKNGSSTNLATDLDDTTFGINDQASPSAGSVTTDDVASRIIDLADSVLFIKDQIDAGFSTSSPTPLTGNQASHTIELAQVGTNTGTSLEVKVALPSASGLGTDLLAVLERDSEGLVVRVNQDQFEQTSTGYLQVKLNLDSMQSTVDGLDVKLDPSGALISSGSGIAVDESALSGIPLTSLESLAANRIIGIGAGGGVPIQLDDTAVRDIIGLGTGDEVSFTQVTANIIAGNGTSGSFSAGANTVEVVSGIITSIT